MLSALASQHQEELLTILRLIPYNYTPCNNNDNNNDITVDTVVEALRQFVDKCEHENNRWVNLGCTSVSYFLLEPKDQGVLSTQAGEGFMDPSFHKSA